MKQLLFFSLLFVLGQSFRTQDVYQQQNDPSSLTLDTLFTDVNSKGDLIHISVSNPGEEDREFIVDIVAVEAENSYWGTIYSAAINKDSYFFKQWRDAKKLSEKMNIRYILPGYGKIHHGIEADEAIDLSFTITGKPIGKGIPVQLRVTTVDNNEVVYSPVFYIYKQPE
ncbi:MAG: hypothetical protein KIT80_09910 [Chitinophagaceae bacterium]|nr:hypothetical protein [Chitinophagaceae bacterium]MCW5927215.1 hypothetical protein [Chitinophagaceae bacterium]